MSDRGARLVGASCPLPVGSERVTLAHGAGTRASTELFERVVRAHLANPALDARHDGALIELGDERLAFTTDTFVVHPLEFPGGDIGSLAVHGTVNDLAMCGAEPLGLSCALVLEEGLPIATLERVIASMASAAREAGVAIVTGDTKVVERGKGDGLFVNTAGVGRVPPGRDVRPARVRAGDAVVLSGPLASHGVAVLSVREGLAFETTLESDSAPLHGLVARAFETVSELHCLRDPTRGGLGAALSEIAGAASGVDVVLEEEALPFEPPVRAACELLGLDPLYLASEGCCIAFVPEGDADRLVDAWRRHARGRRACRVGRVEAGSGRVLVRTGVGSTRRLVLPAGDPLPRIC